jgi:hypothetical protein
VGAEGELSRLTVLRLARVEAHDALGESTCRHSRVSTSDLVRRQPRSAAQMRPSPIGAPAGRTAFRAPRRRPARSPRREAHAVRRRQSGPRTLARWHATTASLFHVLQLQPERGLWQVGSEVLRVSSPTSRRRHARAPRHQVGDGTREGEALRDAPRCVLGVDLRAEQLRVPAVRMGGAVRSEPGRSRDGSL